MRSPSVTVTIPFSTVTVIVSLGTVSAPTIVSSYSIDAWKRSSRSAMEPARSSAMSDSELSLPRAMYPVAAASRAMPQAQSTALDRVNSIIRTP
ncbi:MAG: hypothetical protein Q4Q62_06575 [Thermoplasmata archaeon]|nr:hypothetical protein [Thermoplasmata archaeon]